MRITSIETFLVSNRSMLVRVETDEGVVGWGEPVLENWARAVEGAVARLSEQLIGRDPLATTRLWQLMTRGGFYRGGAVLASAVAGIDQALWDIKGRWHGVPVHELLGGPTRERVRMYAHAGADTRTGDPVRARELVAAGFDLLKVAPDGPRAALGSPASLDRLVAEVGELRDAVGDDVDIALDFHGRIGTAEARRLLAALEPLRPAFVEEPMLPEHGSRLRDIAASTSIPIAVGERLYSRADFAPVLAAGIAIAQPDVSHAGGITECLRIAAAAETVDVLIAPHCPLGPVALAACIQLDFAIPNLYAQEQTLDLHRPDTDALRFVRNRDAFALVDGSFRRPTGPGLGIEIDEDAVRAAVADGPLPAGSPTWTTPDGAFAEW